MWEGSVSTRVTGVETTFTMLVSVRFSSLESPCLFVYKTKETRLSTIKPRDARGKGILVVRGSRSGDPEDVEGDPGRSGLTDGVNITNPYRHLRGQYTSVFSTPRDSSCIRGLPTWGSYHGVVTTNPYSRLTHWDILNYQTTLRKSFKGLVTGMVIDISPPVFSRDYQIYNYQTTSPFPSVL